MARKAPFTRQEVRKILAAWRPHNGGAAEIFNLFSIKREMVELPPKLKAE
jgi:hypothetical protein